jgi:hypothetical protein
VERLAVQPFPPPLRAAQHQGPPPTQGRQLYHEPPDHSPRLLPLSVVPTPPLPLSSPPTSSHGQSEYNTEGRIGGDSGLSEHGLAYAHKLAEFVEQKVTRDPEGRVLPARLWTSTMRRTIETAQFISNPKISILSVLSLFFFFFLLPNIAGQGHRRPQHQSRVGPDAGSAMGPSG